MSLISRSLAILIAMSSVLCCTVKNPPNRPSRPSPSIDKSTCVKGTPRSTRKISAKESALDSPPLAATSNRPPENIIASPTDEQLGSLPEWVGTRPPNWSTCKEPSFIMVALPKHYSLNHSEQFLQILRTYDEFSYTEKPWLNAFEVYWELNLPPPSPHTIRCAYALTCERLATIFQNVTGRNATLTCSPPPTPEGLDAKFSRSSGGTDCARIRACEFKRTKSCTADCGRLPYGSIKCAAMEDCKDVLACYKKGMAVPKPRIPSTYPQEAPLETIDF